MQSYHVKSVPLAPAELAAWRGLLRVHSSLVHRLDADLRARHELPLQEYEVLLSLDGAPEGRMRMSDLAASVLLSQSGLTRLVDRLVRTGLVVRTRCLDDRRGLNAEITAAGRTRFAQARPTHLDGIREAFLAHFDEGDLEQLAGFWERVLPGASSS